jgi:uncharacterized protein YgbK (DUF1537 family)
MPKLIVAADDLTGALDTGVQFAKRGIETRIFPNGKIDFSELGSANVAVVNTASRHIPAAEAYRIVFDLMSAAKANGFDYFYKKTDSVLRGNVGAELSALRDAVNEPIAFVPAFPAMGRTTINGMHYVDGVPVADSALGKDPFSPLASSCIKEIIRQSGAKENAEAEIEVFNAASDAELLQIAQSLTQRNAKVFAGCAGFAAFLPEIINFTQTETAFEHRGAGLFVITGSVNPVTLEQIDYAKNELRFSSFVVPESIKLAHDNQFLAAPDSSVFDSRSSVFNTKIFLEDVSSVFREKGKIIISSVAADKTDFIESPREDLHGLVARNIGGIAAALMTQFDAAFFLIGGDVLLECIAQFKPDSLQPLAEPVPGVAFVKLRKASREIDVYTKSGGFGEQDVILSIEKHRGSKLK